VFSILYYKLPRQLIHNDFHGGNVLFHIEQMTGIIDLDSCKQNVRIYDLVRFSGWLLYCMRDDRKNWLSALSNLLHGYNSITCLTVDEINSIFFMLYSMGISCIATFFRTSIDDTVLYSINALDWIIDNRRSIDRIGEGLYPE